MQSLPKSYFLASLTLWCPSVGDVSGVYWEALLRLKVDLGYLCAYWVVLAVVTRHTELPTSF